MTKLVIKRNVLREDIKKYIMDMIKNGDLKPGDRLVETSIAKELGVSQSPVREAFHNLEQMGILEIRPYKGTFMNQLSVDDLKDVYLVRAALEGLAIKMAVPRITELEIHSLESKYERMIKAVEANDLLKQIQYDIEFHEIIIKAARINILEKAWYTVRLSQWTYYGYYKYEEIKLAERHNLILEAIRSRDAEKAAEVMRAHFLELHDFLEENWPKGST